VTRDGNGDADPLDLWDRLEMLARAAHPELCAGCRKIAVGDELALTPAELHPMERAVVSVRRASGAASCPAPHPGLPFGRQALLGRWRMIPNMRPPPWRARLRCVGSGST